MWLTRDESRFFNKSPGEPTITHYNNSNNSSRRQKDIFHMYHVCISIYIGFVKPQRLLHFGTTSFSTFGQNSETVRQLILTTITRDSLPQVLAPPFLPDRLLTSILQKFELLCHLSQQLLEPTRRLQQLPETRQCTSRKLHKTLAHHETDTADGEVAEQ